MTVKYPELPSHFGSLSMADHLKSPTYALVGNPNSGKTTLFNALTGLRQKVANYPGVTVEKKVGTAFSQHGQKLEIIDLPGSYSLSAQSPDEAILQKVLLGRIQGCSLPDRIICVVNAANLERMLYLAAQVVELGLPTILVLNMMDIAEDHGLFIDTGRIEKELGVVVVPCQAHKKEGLIPLRLTMSRAVLPQPNGNLELASAVSEALVKLQSHIMRILGLNLPRARGRALLLLTEGTDPAFDTPDLINLVNELRQELDRTTPTWRADIINARYGRITKLFNEAVHQRAPIRKTLTDSLDKVLLHKFWGWICLFAVMGSLFWSIFSLSTYPMKGIEWCFDQLSIFLGNVLSPGPLRGLLVNGVISGVGSVLVFLPQIFLLFFFIGILESTGYLPRAAFILDRVLNKVGLNGKSFIPLLSSYACAIPGILSTRTLRCKHVRLATILIAPWMSCSARLPVYLLMIATLIPDQNASSLLKSTILLLCYTLATFCAFGMAWLLRKTLLKGKSSDSLMELPPFRMPGWGNIFHEMINRSMSFVKRAGTLILSFSIVLWFLMSYPQHPRSTGEALYQGKLEQSYIGTIGKTIEPILKPLGYDWRIDVGLLSSFAARELFVSTLAIIYNVETSKEDASSLATVLQRQQKPDGSPIFSPLTCASLIVFFMFAMQCVSTLAVTQKETNSLRWPALQFTYMSAFAYVAAFLVFQIGTLLGF